MDKIAEKVVYTGAIDAYFDFKLGSIGIPFSYVLKQKLLDHT